jgi:hypothetical protein
MYLFLIEFSSLGMVLIFALLNDPFESVLITKVCFYSLQADLKFR